MSTKLTLVSDGATASESEAIQTSETSSTPLAPQFIAQAPLEQKSVKTLRRWSDSAKRVVADERGAVTAEYAIVIMAAVAFAGLLVAIMRSDAIREMLVKLVENALGTGG